MADFNRKNYDPEAVIGTFFSANDSNALVEIILWNGLLGFKFKRIGRTPDGKYNKDATREIRFYPKRPTIQLLSMTLDETIKNRMIEFRDGKPYSEFDRPLETSNDRYDTRTGEKTSFSVLKLATVKDVAGNNRVALIGQNASDTIEIVFYTSEERANIQIPSHINIDKGDLELAEFGALMKSCVQSNLVQSVYNIVKAFADRNYYRLCKVMGKEPYSNNNEYNGSIADESNTNGVSYHSGGNYDDSSFNDDDDSPFA